jgi:spermidine synthase
MIDQPLEPATLSEMNGVRYLHLGTRWVQGAMRLSTPHALELEYVRRMMAWMLLCSPQGWQQGQGHAIQLGLGAGSITRFCHYHLGLRTTAVELNSSVITACRLWFRLPHNDDRLTVIESDAAHYVAQPRHAAIAQSLQVDLYDHNAQAPMLDNETFYRGCYNVLEPGGVMSVNLFGRDASFEHSAQLIAKVFGVHAVCSLEPTKEGNTVLLALKNTVFPDADALALRAKNIETALPGLELKAEKWLRMLRLPPLLTLNS